MALRALVLLVCAAGCLAETCPTDVPSPATLISQFGYPAESHNVTTTDGYILGLYRIPGPASSAEGTQQEGGNGGSSAARPAILLMHGLSQNAATYLLLKEKSLPFLLADNGFDVWLGSCRGTSQSSHLTLSPESEKFWDFSWHENGVYDVPAFVSYIKAVTGQARIGYVGHSMGTTMFLVMCSMLPEQCERDIASAYLLAPVSFMRHSKGLLRPIADDVEAPLSGTIADVLLFTVAHGTFDLSAPKVRKMTVPFCSDELTTGMCLDMTEPVVGATQPGRISRETLYYTTCYSTDNMSVKQNLHYAQSIIEVSENWFRQYDYKDKITNLLKYGSIEPPSYPLDKISVNLTMYFSECDVFSQPSDLLTLLSQLPPRVSRMHQVLRPKFSHIDYLLADDAPVQVYKDLVQHALEDLQ